MKAACVFFAFGLVALSACKTTTTPTTFGTQATRVVTGPSPTGTFVYPNENCPLVKVRLDSDGSYTAEDFSEPNYWVMMEGNRVYFEPLKRHPQKGHWTWNPETGELWLVADITGDLFKFCIERLHFETQDPDRLRWGEFAYLQRSKTSEPGK